MKLAVSNRAWPLSQEASSLAALGGLVEGVSVSMQRMEDSIRTVRQSMYTRARAQRLALVQRGMVAMCLEQVADVRHGNFDEGREALFARFHLALDVAIEMECEIITMVGPSLRRGLEPSLDTLWETLCLRAEREQVTLVIEPAPALYGGEYWHTLQEVEEATAGMVGTVMGLDTTALSFERAPRSTLVRYAGQVPYIAVSSPGLGPIRAKSVVPHRRFANDLARLGQSNRAPDWMVLRMQSQSMRDMLESLDIVRCLYAGVLRQVPF